MSHSWLIIVQVQMWFTFHLNIMHNIEIALNQINQIFIILYAKNMVFLVVAVSKVPKTISILIISMAPSQ